MASNTILPTGNTTSISVGGYVNGTGNLRQEFIVPLLPGAFTQATGTGEFSVTTPGTRGSIDVTLMTGVGGSARAVAFLVDATATRYIGIAVDTANRPYALISTDGSGTVLARSFPIGTTLPAGQVLRARLVFDSTAAVHGGAYVAMSVNDVFANLDVALTAPWTTFVPAKLLVGNGASLAAYNGALAPFVQFSGQTAQLNARPIVINAPAEPGTALSSTASVTSDIDVERGASVALASSAAVVANLGVEYATTAADMASSAAVAANLGVNYAVTADLSSSAALDATADLIPP